MNNKVALVTGGTSGIGKEIVKELIEKGCKYYVEQRYNGIYEVTEEDFNLIKSYIK